MAVESHHSSLPGVTASADLSATNYRFVKVDGEFTVGLTALGEAAAGVVFNCPELGCEAGVYGIGDVAKLEAGAAIAVGSLVGSDATGRGKVAATGEFANAIALEAASAAGEIISVYMMPHGIQA